MAYINIVRNSKPDQLPPLDPAGSSLNDEDRIKALHRFEIMDSPSEEIFSTYTELAALTFKTSMALMTFVDDESVFYKQAYGFSKTGKSVPLHKSPCSIAILRSEVSLFRYIITDPCVKADEKLLAQEGYEFYAGAPLITKDGFNIGMLAVVDNVPRTYSEEELGQLKNLAFEVMKEVEFRLESKNKSAIPILNERLKALHRRVEKLRL
jgi:GAF domain-containing protein